MSLEAEQFGAFLKQQREQRNIERDKLGEGIYRDNAMGKIERGERYPDKPTRDRLLARTGESGYEYECFLLPEEYEDWRERQQLLDSLDDLELAKAEQLLLQYEKKHDKAEKVQQQFLLVMRLQWMELAKAPEEERLLMIARAVKQTVPKVDTEPVSELALSIQELNLVAEYVRYKQPEHGEELLLQLWQYLWQDRFDLLSRAMLGAKIALYYCRQKNRKNTEPLDLVEEKTEVETSLALLDRALDCLRTANKTYYAVELLEQKEACLQWLLAHRLLFTEKKAEQYETELRQTKDFYAVLCELYQSYGVPRETNGYTCFYREWEIYCINDVIRTRRRMLGISATELEEGICSKRTLVRLENKESAPQRAVTQALFQKLKLSMALHRAQLVTEKQEVLRLEEDFREQHNQRKLESAAELLALIKQNVSLDILLNRQYITYEEFCLQYSMGKLTKEEFISHAIEALELTIPLTVAMEELKPYVPRHGKRRDGEKYLTNTEVTILKNLAAKTGKDEENKYWKILREYFDFLEKQCTIAPILSMYGFVMTEAASCIGNEGRYEESSAINRKIIKESLRARSVSYASRNMYGLVWNDRKQKSLPMTKEDPEWCLNVRKCLTVDMFCNDGWHGSIMKKRLGMEQES